MLRDTVYAKWKFVNGRFQVVNARKKRVLTSA